MKKDFQKWHARKEKIDNLQRPFFQEREIWFCYLGVNIGFEQDGAGEEFMRPVVIVRKFNNELFWGIPLSKSRKLLSNRITPYYFDFEFVESIMSRALLSQMRPIDGRRLTTRAGYISKADFLVLKAKLKALLP